MAALENSWPSVTNWKAAFYFVYSEIILQLICINFEIKYIKMGRTNATVDELKTYFKTHSKIREQKAHTSKVIIIQKEIVGL